MMDTLIPLMPRQHLNSVTLLLAFRPSRAAELAGVIPSSAPSTEAGLDRFLLLVNVETWTGRLIRTASERTGRFDHRLAEVFGSASAAEAEINRWLAGLEEHLQFWRQRTVIRQNPGARLKHIRIRGLRPGRQRGVGGQPGLVGEDMASHVSDRGQAPSTAPPVPPTAGHRPATRLSITARA